MQINNKFGVGLIATAVLVMLLGTIGFTIEDSVDSVPTPNVPNSVFFADEPIQSNPLALIIAANVEITWDRNDVFIVVADTEKKDQCEGLTYIETLNQNSELCTSRDNDYEAIGDDNQAGLDYEVKSGAFYIGVGTYTETPDDFALDIDYEVKLTLSPAGYFLMVLTFFVGFVLNKYQ